MWRFCRYDVEVVQTSCRSSLSLLIGNSLLFVSPKLCIVLLIFRSLCPPRTTPMNSIKEFRYDLRIANILFQLYNAFRCEKKVLIDTRTARMSMRYWPLTHELSDPRWVREQRQRCWLAKQKSPIEHCCSRGSKVCENPEVVHHYL